MPFLRISEGSCYTSGPVFAAGSVSVATISGRTNRGSSLPSPFPEASVSSATGSGSSASCKHLLDALDRSEDHVRAHLDRNVLEIAFVIERQDHGVDPARWAPSTFSLTPPILSTLPRSVISPVIAIPGRALRRVSRLTSAVHSATPGRRAVLGDRARRQVHVEVGVLEELRIDAELARRASGCTRVPPARTPSSRRRAGR